MTMTRLVGMVSAAIVLAGCATTMPPPTGGTRGACSLVTAKSDCPGTFTKVTENLCKGASCDTDVNIAWDGNACQVMVGAQTIKMDKGNSGAFLRWFLPTGSKWEFREESTLFALPIHFIDQNATGLHEQFSQRSVIANGRGVHIKNLNTNKSKYDYKLRVFKQGGGANDCIDSTDPAIQNDP